MIKEEVDKMRAQAEMDMYVLTNTSRNFGAACITYPGVLKEFAREHNSDFYIISKFSPRSDINFGRTDVCGRNESDGGRSK